MQLYQLPQPSQNTQLPETEIPRDEPPDTCYQTNNNHHGCQFWIHHIFITRIVYVSRTVLISLLLFGTKTVLNRTMKNKTWSSVSNSTSVLPFIPYTGCPTKNFIFFKPVYLRPLISLRKSSVLEMNLWISAFKNTNSKFSRIFVLRDLKRIRYYFRLSGYS